MAPRPNWKGYLKLSLVSCPIALYPATSGSERVSFRQINRVTGNRLRQQLVDEGTREPVESADKARGYEIGKNQYLLIEDEEIESIQVESTHTIEIDNFVPAAQIDKRYFDAPYYIIPNGNVGQDAFAVIRDAMKGKAMVALGRVVMAKRERVIALEPEGKGLLGMALRYPYEVRDAADYFDDIEDVKIPAEMRQLAEHILDNKTTDFDPSKFEDHYEVALVEMLRQKQAGRVLKAAPPTPKPTNVVSLMDALKRSVAQEQRSTPPAKASKSKGKGKPEDIRKQPQFKLPIAGGKKKKAEEAAKPTARPAKARKRA